MSSLGYATKSVHSAEYYSKKKERKMNWFTRWFDRKVRNAWERAQNPYDSQPAESVSTNVSVKSNGLEMSIYGADGGTILEFRHYDPGTDRNNYSLHVISQNENFEERVGSAITMELLRRGLTR